MHVQVITKARMLKMFIIYKNINNGLKYVTKIFYSWVSLCKYAVNLSGGQPQRY